VKKVKNNFQKKYIFYIQPIGLTKNTLSRFLEANSNGITSKIAIEVVGIPSKWMIFQDFVLLAAQRISEISISHVKIEGNDNLLKVVERVLGSF